VTDGELLPTPPWHGFVSAEWESASLSNGARAYFHLDDSYTSGYRLMSTPQDGDYNAFLPQPEAVNILSARVGVRREGWDASLFVKNLLDAHPVLGGLANPTGINPEFVHIYTINPRVIGITSTYRF
jgi:iron complex outermembrane receptor protein